MFKIFYKPISIVLLAIAICCGCGTEPQPTPSTMTVIDQLGRTVIIPLQVDRIAALHHFGGLIIYALGAQDKLVEQALYGIEKKAREAVDPEFAAMPNMLEAHTFNVESLVSLKPQIAFVYASFNKSEMALLENAGVQTIAVRGETLEESFAAVRLIGRVLGKTDKADAYVADCKHLLNMVQEKIADIPEEKRLKVMFSGPKGVYTVATGEMLQSRILAKAGADNVAALLKGFWGKVSPEQVALWNPDVIFIGSSLYAYGIEDVYENTHFETIKAVRNKRVYIFPSNVGWWDYPAPRCVLGVLWAATTCYPNRFRDVDVLKVADTFYEKYVGFSFSALGGKLPS